MADVQWTRPEAIKRPHRRVDDDEIPFHALRRQDGAERTAAPCSLSSSSCSLERLRPRSGASKRHALGRNPARKSVAWRGWRRTSQRVGSGRKHCNAASKHKQVVPSRPCMQRLHRNSPKVHEKGTPARPCANFCRPLDGGSTSHVGSVCGARLLRAQPREPALSALQSPAPWVALDTRRAPDEPPTHAYAPPRRRN